MSDCCPCLLTSAMSRARVEVSWLAGYDWQTGFSMLCVSQDGITQWVFGDRLELLLTDFAHRWVGYMVNCLNLVKQTAAVKCTYHKITTAIPNIKRTQPIDLDYKRFVTSEALETYASARSLASSEMGFIMVCSTSWLPLWFVGKRSTLGTILFKASYYHIGNTSLSAFS